jgi:hypothetical protein
MAVLEARVGEIEGVDEGGGVDTMVVVGIGEGIAVAVGDGIVVDVAVGVIVGVAVGDSVEVGEGVVVEVGEGVVVGVDVSSRARACFIPEFATTVTVAAIACGPLTAANAPMNESSMSMRDSTPTNALPGVNLV